SRDGRIEPVLEETTAPADRYRLPAGTVFGVISSTTAPFCAACDRSRLTADGVWYLCLYALQGTDLRGPLRRGATREELAGLVTGRWRERADRGAEQRLAPRERTPPVQNARLKEDPHLEMHTRGGEAAARGRGPRARPNRPRSMRGRAGLVTGRWRERADRGAEQRLALRERTPLVQIARLKEDPHLEMHTRGG